MSFFKPMTNKVIGHLSDVDAMRLRVWSDAHANLFDWRLHSMKTCPFLAYIPHYLTADRGSAEWALWLFEFYKAKHAEEGNCKCATKIVAAITKDGVK